MGRMISRGAREDRLRAILRDLGLNHPRHDGEDFDSQRRQFKPYGLVEDVDGAF
jgi:hypothetical protein